MKRNVLLLTLCLAAGPAAADCYPPPGLAPQQWYAMCGPTLEDGFARGMGGGLMHDDFLVMMYRMYLSSGGAAAPMPQQPVPMMQQCVVGSTQCFSGWFRRCEIRGNSAMWITGAQRCR